MPKKLAVITTHPIQYYAPLFQLLAKQVNLKVFYTWGEASLNKYDPGFGKVIEWDIPLLEGYPYQFVKNESKNPGSHHFKGIINPDLISQISDFKPDAILVIGYAYHSHLQVMRHFKGKIPLWFRGDSTLLDEVKGWKKYVKSFYLKWIYTHIDLAFYVGTANKAYFKKYGLKENQLLFAPHAIDNDRFAIDRSEEAQQLRLSLQIKDEDILILFAGKLEPKKDPELLLEAFLDMIKEHRAKIKENVHLLFVGNGVLEESLKSKVDTSTPLSVTDTASVTNEGKRIHFMDFQNQQMMPVVYQACNIFCLPSKGPGETWGLAVNEAMATGKAVIVSNKVGCAADLVIPHKNGDVFVAGSVDKLVKALVRLLKKDSSIFGRNSAEIIQEWTITKQAEVIIKALHD